MSKQKTKKECPECRGEKVIPGSCECSSEWRGTQDGDDWNDCQCNIDGPCTTCNGAGFIEE